MSGGARRSLGLALALFLACLAQMVYADALRLFGAPPDFVLLIALLGAMFCDANGGALIGFCAGLLRASIAGPPHAGFGSMVVSTTLVGFGIGWLEKRIFRDNPLLALAFAAVGTALAEALFFIFSPQPHILHWARGLGLTTLYNALLALPVYLLLRRLIGPPGRDEA